MVVEGRRGRSFLSTSGSFVLSGSSSTGPNTAGNEEELGDSTEIIDLGDGEEHLGEGAGFGKEHIRLVGGTAEKHSGRLEVQHNGEWGTVSTAPVFSYMTSIVCMQVCDDSFDMKDAAVACWQLGLGAAVSHETAAAGMQGTADQKTWLDDVDCGGSEATLAACTHAGWG